MRHKLKIAMLVLSASLQGCSLFGLTEQKEVKVQRLTPGNELSLASIPAQLRGAYIRDQGSTNSFTICAEPFSDVAASSSAKATLEASNKLNTIINNKIASSNSTGSTKSLDGNQTADLQQSLNGAVDYVNTIVALDGRTQYVLLAREMMFRTCEAASNGWLGGSKEAIADNVKSEHLAIIDALIKMVSAEQQKAKAQSDQAIASVASQVVNNKLDPAVLKGMSPMTSVLTTSLENELITCITKAKDDKEKNLCAESFARQMKNL